MTGAGQVHRHTGLLGRLNDLLVTDGSAGLHDGLYTGVHQRLGAICEREERVGRGDRTGGAIGAAYGLGVAMTYTVTGAALNPARATGIALFGQNQGLSTQPLQQLWIFWLAPVLAAAIVALVMIIADMASKRKPKTPADAPIDEATDAEADAHDIAVDAAVNAAPQVPSTNPEQ